MAGSEVGLCQRTSGARRYPCSDERRALYDILLWYPDSVELVHSNTKAIEQSVSIGIYKRTGDQRIRVYAVQAYTLVWKLGRTGAFWIQAVYLPREAQRYAAWSAEDAA